MRNSEQLGVLEVVPSLGGVRRPDVMTLRGMSSILAAEHNDIFTLRFALTYTLC